MNLDFCTAAPYCCWDVEYSKNWRCGLPGMAQKPAAPWNGNGGRIAEASVLCAEAVSH